MKPSQVGHRASIIKHRADVITLVLTGNEVRLLNAVQAESDVENRADLARATRCCLEIASALLRRLLSNPLREVERDRARRSPQLVREKPEARRHAVDDTSAELHQLERCLVEVRVFM